jgi:hypothetical protein
VGGAWDWVKDSDVTRLSRNEKYVFVVATLWFVVSTAFCSHRTGWFQFVSLAVLPFYLAAILASVVLFVAECRSKGWIALRPVTVCGVALVAPFCVAMPIRHVIFARTFPSYESVVREMEAGRIAISTNMEPIPQATAQAPSAYVVLAQRETNGGLMVEFLTERGFPLKHSGYLYCSWAGSNAAPEVQSRWSTLFEVKPNWFYFSD